MSGERFKLLPQLLLCACVLGYVDAKPGGVVEMGVVVLMMILV